MSEIKEITSLLKTEIIKSLQECLKIKSISGDEEGTRQVLDFYLNLGRQLGFKAKNIDNLGGIIEFGEGGKSLGIIIHLDTVPEGTGWTVPPFAGQIKDGKIYGRGAIDDKGPAISVLYALKAVKDGGIEPNCKIQILAGIDEEGVWHTTPKFLTKIKEPAFSFVPDSQFPLVLAEKGLIWLEVQIKFPNYKTGYPLNTRPENKQTNPEKAMPGLVIKKMAGGSESLNIVPDYCEAILELAGDAVQTYSAAEPNQNGNALPDHLILNIKEKLRTFLSQQESWKQASPMRIELTEEKDELKLISHGKSAHAFSCDEGQNAISQLLKFLGQLDLAEDQKRFIDHYNTLIGMEYYGESLGLTLEDELTGKLTVSPGYIRLDKETVTLKLDIRFPAGEQLAKMKTRISAAFQKFEGSLKIIDSLESLNFPKDDPNIQKLLRVYKQYTGDNNATPLGMGGTTFAKAFTHAVAFGPTFPGMAKVEHQPDEYMEIEHLMQCTEIYALAIKELITNQD